MDIETIRKKIENGTYLIKSHVIQHALKEGFERKHIEEAIFSGKIIEIYPEEKRLLICGKITLSQRYQFYLHVVCEYSDEEYLELITSYIPDEKLWSKPPYSRLKKKWRKK